jgi:Flp pilus assembly pilin Flp
MDSVKRFIHNDAGADLIEYALLVGLISLAAMTSLSGVGTSIGKIWSNIAATLKLQEGIGGAPPAGGN